MTGRIEKARGCGRRASVPCTRGITGRGIGIGIIDQILLTDHVEYRDRLRFHEEIGLVPDPAQMHGPAVASIAVGKTAGVAPGADLYYIASSNGTGPGRRRPLS